VTAPEGEGGRGADRMKITLKSLKHRTAASRLIVASASATGSTKISLINAADKKQTVADAIDYIEEEKAENEVLRKWGWKK
jgi:hypothetical protein